MTSRSLYAAIDVGTNSVHIVIASISTEGVLTVHSNDKEVVRLGEMTSDMRYLTPQAASRGVLALKRFVAMAENQNAEVRAIATSALREADNADLFVKEVRNETGISVEVISGVEEARLIYLGVLQALPVYDNRTLIIDIGGGSTETAIGTAGDLHAVYSHKLGAIRLSRRFLSKATLTDKAIRQCREHIRGEIAPAIRTLKKTKFDTVVGSSGTIQTIFSMVALRDNPTNPPEKFNGMEITGRDVLWAVGQLLEQKTVKKRAGIPGMDPKRADIIVGGALILEQLVQELKIKTLRFSHYALREGILLDTVQKRRNIRKYHHLNRLRYESVLHLSEHCRVNLTHAKHVRRLAVRLFDALQADHGYGDEEREILEAAAWLHDVGYVISAQAHHRHSYYIIKNSNLLGFTNNEIELIANVARYHRKSHPKPKHESLQRLPQDLHERMCWMAGILRIAEGLDRRRLQNVISLTVKKKARTTLISVQTRKNGPSPDIEVWGASRKQTLLEQCLGRPVRIEITV